MANKQTLKRRAQRRRQKERELMPAIFPQTCKATTCLSAVETLYQEQHKLLISQIYGTSKQKEEGETTMTTYDHTQVQQTYFKNQINHIFANKELELERHFGLKDDPIPKTGTEAIQRIKDGKIKVLTDVPAWYNWTDQIRWIDPEKKQDYDGFHRAREKLHTEHTRALNHIIGKPEKALEAVETFEKVTVH